MLLMAFFAITSSAYDFSATHTFQVQQDNIPIDYENELYYAINEDGTSVTVVQGPEKYAYLYVNIPATVRYGGKTYRVTAIGYEAFKEAEIGHVTMSNNVKEIQTSAFFDSDVASVEFSEGLQTIGQYAFQGAKNLGYVYLYEGLKSIGERAFECRRGNTNSYIESELRTVHLPESLTEIGASAFCGNQKLHEINLPQNLKKINEYLFTGDKALTSIALPPALQLICRNAFGGTGLEEISFPSTLTEIEQDAFRQTNLRVVVLPNTITKVGDHAFIQCSLLEEFTFSSGMTEIMDHALDGSSKLNKVVIPNGITKIGEYAFAFCPLLSSITLPESVNTLEGGIFDHSGIQTIHLPSSLTYLGASMFRGCNQLTTFTVPNTIQEIKDGAFIDCQNLTTVVIPESVTSIGNHAFQGCISLTDVSLPNSINTISSQCFESCKSLQTIIIPNSVTSLQNACFRYCYALNSITIPQSVTTIEESVFWYCPSLESLTIPSSVESIGRYTFWYCTMLKGLHINRAIPPTATSSSGLPELINSDIECVLYVPQGSKATYQEETGYENFFDVVEENVDGTVYYQISVTTNGYGDVQVNNKVASKHKVRVNARATLKSVPSNGFHLKTLKVNGSDVTASMSGDSYVISKVTQNYKVEAEFEENPVLLKTMMGDGGQIGVRVKKGDKYTCDILTEEGWRVNTVTFNGNDVTSSVVDGVYTTPELYADSQLRVSFERTGVATQVIGSGRISGMKAWATDDGVLHIVGAEAGEVLDVYTSDGKHLTKCVSDGHSQEVSLPTHGVYIVRSAEKTIKLSY